MQLKGRGARDRLRAHDGHCFAGLLDGPGADACVRVDGLLLRMQRRRRLLAVGLGQGGRRPGGTGVGEGEVWDGLGRECGDGVMLWTLGVGRWYVRRGGDG